MISPFAVAAAISGVLAIAADWNERRHRSFYLLKPLTTLLILGIAASAPANAYQELIVAALVLSMLGDVCLMFNGDVWFGAGLGSFLIAHALFVAAFVQGLHPIAVPLYAWAVLPYGAVLLYFLLPRTGPLKLPVLVYCSVIGLMVVTAAARYNGFGDPAALRVLIGALFFLASDSLLAVRQFVGPYAGAQALILSTYWIAVGLIASSA